uniref:Uncharacterized protein n=1 Tax=Anguilla anguilla TaxID=7936 RepID=A0A0E9QEV0_ANGAN
MEMLPASVKIWPPSISASHGSLQTGWILGLKTVGKQLLMGGSGSQKGLA